MENHLPMTVKGCSEELSAPGRPGGKARVHHAPAPGEEPPPDRQPFLDPPASVRTGAASYVARRGQQYIPKAVWKFVKVKNASSFLT